MSDKDLGEALLKLNLNSKDAPRGVEIEQIITADHRKVRRLTQITVALWVVALLGAISIFIAGGLVFPMISKLLNQAGEGSLNNANTPFLMLAKLMAMCIVFGSLSFAILVGAGLATVILVFRSRRATLRQINSNLLQISEQLNRKA